MQEPGTTSIATTKDTGIKTIADVRGKRVAKVLGSFAFNLQMAGALAHGGLTWDDVEVVDVPGFGAGQKALMEGSVDVALVSALGGLAYEIDAKKGIVWLEPSRDPEVIKSATAITLYYTPGWFTAGAGIEPGERVWAFIYPLTIAALPDSSPSIAYHYIKGVWEGYDAFKDKHPLAALVTHEFVSDYTLAIIPFHEGTVEFFKEVGAWTPEHEAWQKMALAKEDARMAEWPKAVAVAMEQGIGIDTPEWGDYYTGFWRKWLDDRDLVLSAAVKGVPE